MHGQKLTALDTNCSALYIGAVVAMAVSAHTVLLDRSIGIALIIALASAIAGIALLIGA